MRLAAILAVTAVLLASVPCRAQEDEDDLPPSVMSSAEIELDRRRNAPPQLGVSPMKITRTVEPGDSAKLTLTVRNAGGRMLRWSVASAPTWISFKEERGELGFEKETRLSLVADAGDLPAGTVRGSVAIEAQGAAGSPTTVPITLVIAAPAEEPEEEPKKRARAKPARSARETGPTRRERPRRRVPERGDDTGPSGRRGGRFGVRLGYAGFGSPADVSVGGVPFGGLYLAGGKLGKLPYEIGLDVTRPGAENDSFDTLLFTGQFDLLFHLRNDAAAARPYLLSGIKGLLEAVDDVNESSTNVAGAVDVGLGMGFGRGRFDVRATYSLLLGSDNAAGITLVSAGVRF